MDELIAINWFNGLSREEQLPHMLRYDYPTDSRAITNKMKVHMYENRDRVVEILEGEVLKAGTMVMAKNKVYIAQDVSGPWEFVVDGDVGTVVGDNIQLMGDEGTRIGIAIVWDKFGPEKQSIIETSDVYKLLNRVKH